MITITWTATTLGANFGRYVLSRLTAGTWDVIANIYTEATVTFQDFEHRWTVEEQYQVQVVNGDGDVSPPSGVAVTKPFTAASWTIGSNHSDVSIDADVQTGLSVGMPSDRQTYVPYGRDFHLSTSTGRRRGVKLTFNVAVYDQPGMDKYAGWFDLAAEDVPYWSVADEHGGRRFVAITLAGASENVDSWGDLTVEAVQVAATPVPVVVP